MSNILFQRFSAQSASNYLFMDDIGNAGKYNGWHSPPFLSGLRWLKMESLAKEGLMVLRHNKKFKALAATRWGDLVKMGNYLP